MNAIFVDAGSNLEGLGLGFLCLFGCDKAVLFHALNDVQLARTSAFGIADGVVSRGCFGQAGQHGRFGNADVF